MYNPEIKEKVEEGNNLLILLYLVGKSGNPISQFYPDNILKRFIPEVHRSQWQSIQ